MALVKAITQPSPASAEASPRPMSDAGAVRRMFPVRYTPKGGSGSAGVREPRRKFPNSGSGSVALEVAQEAGE